MMSTQTRKEYVRAIKPKYLKISKKEKTKKLDEAVALTKYNRSYLIRLLSPRTDLSKPKEIDKRAGRRWRYDPETIVILAQIWKLLDYPCGLRLKAELPEMIRVLKRCEEIHPTHEQEKALTDISARTIDRRLKREKEIQRIGNKRGFCTTKPGTLKSKIPLRRGYEWEEDVPGFLEIDTVAHNGGDPSGTFIFTLNATDIASGWTEAVAGLGKSQYVVIETGFKGTIVPALPFSLRGVDGDSGGEIINELLYRYCQENSIVFTRSRPYHSNDGCHIEEKNWTHVRKIIGYGRLDTEIQVIALNDLYRNELRLYLNFFQPHMKCVHKEFTGKRAKRTYEIKTPYQWVLESKVVSQEQKNILKDCYEKLNPVLLKKTIEKKLSALGMLSKV